MSIKVSDNSRYYSNDSRIMLRLALVMSGYMLYNARYHTLGPVYLLLFIFNHDVSFQNEMTCQGQRCSRRGIFILAKGYIQIHK